MTLRNAVFQVHWFLGITAGIVLALVGVTGAVLSFEDELLEALNPGVYSVEPSGREALAPAALLERVALHRPGEAIASLELSADPRDASVVGFAPRDGERRGERRHVDPYDGALLPEPRYQGFFRTTMQLHRWLAVDDIGKQVVGASTVVLVFFCLSGLYLRWPRRLGSLRTWLALDWQRKGRNFLRHLHTIVGTWVLLAYLVMALTGLWWSYGWYREAVNAWAASGEPARPAASAQGGGIPASRGPPPPVDIAAAGRRSTPSCPSGAPRRCRSRRTETPCPSAIWTPTRRTSVRATPSTWTAGRWLPSSTSVTTAAACGGRSGAACSRCTAAASSARPASWPSWWPAC